MKRLVRTLLMMTMAAALPAAAQNATVRVLFYTGNVTLGTGGKPSIGQQLAARDVLTLAAGATLQLSVNGKVIKYAQPMQVNVSDAVKRAGKGENAAVATTVRTLAAASSSGDGRTSQAGATRADGKSVVVEQTTKDAEHQAQQDADDEIRKYTGIDGGTGKAGELGVLRGNRNTLLVALEPRETAVASSSIRFRWMRTPGVENYVVAVRNHVGDVIYRTETSDTTATWDGATLAPEALYSWTLSNARDEGNGPEVSFHRLGEDAARDVSKGTEAIRKELGDDNPALPLLLGTYYADHGCFGEATRYFTSGALVASEHYDDFMQRAVAIYSEQIGLQREELETIYSVK